MGYNNDVREDGVDYWTKINQDPRVSKTNQSHADIFWFSLLKLKNIL